MKAFPSIAFPQAARLVALLLFVCLPLRTWSAAPTTPVVAGLPEPELSVASGVFREGFKVKITAKSPNGVVRYTLDGSEPRKNSPVYSNPITVSASVLLKAKVFDPDSPKTSSVVAANYTFLEPDVAEFSSNIPLVIVQTFGRQISKEEKTQLAVRIINTNNPAGRAALTGKADYSGVGRINARGYTSLRYPKRSYHLKLLDAAGANLNAPVLGLPKESDWVLYAPYPDKTLMRDVIAYEMANEMGHYAPRTRFCEVFLNENGGNISMRDYIGIYVLEEKVKRDKNRVPIAKMEKTDKAEPDVSGGYIFKKDHLVPTDGGGGGNFGGFPSFQGGSSHSGNLTGPGGFPGDPRGFMKDEDGDYSRHKLRLSNPENPRIMDRGFISAAGTTFFLVEPKPEEATREQRLWLARYVNRFETALYGTGFRDPQNGYAAFIDANSFIDYHWLVEMSKNIDGFRFSTFYYKDRNGKIVMGPAWDWNLSMGNATGKQGYLPQYWYWPQLDDQQYSWFRRLFEDPDFAQRYVDRWGQLRTTVLSPEVFNQRVDKWAAVLQEAQVRNFKKWRILGRQIWPNNYVGRTYEDENNYLKQWMGKRLDWINRQFVAAPIASVKQGAVQLRSGVGAVYYTTDGSDPRLSGGAISPKAKQFDQAFNADQAATVTARVLDDKRWSPPVVLKISSGR